MSSMWSTTSSSLRSSSSDSKMAGTLAARLAASSESSWLPFLWSESVVFLSVSGVLKLSPSVAAERVLGAFLKTRGTWKIKDEIEIVLKF